MIGEARGHPLTWADVDVNKYNDLNFHTVPKLGDLLLQDSVEDKHWNGLKKKKVKMNKWRIDLATSATHNLQLYALPQEDPHQLIV